MRAAVEEMGREADIQKAESIKDLAATKIMTTPGPAVDGETVAADIRG